jgi:hypothetical protein
MKTLLRTGFVALIALGLASQALRAGRGEAGADPAEALAGRLERLHVAATADPGSKLLLARSAQCGQPFVVGLLRADGGENELVQQLSRSGIIVRYAYLGAVDEHPSAAAQSVRWGWATLMFSVGARPTRPPGDMVVVAYPRECTALATLDWASLSP